MKVVVGLGNPGRQYEHTRHNIGFDVVDYIARSPDTGPFRAKFGAQIAELAGLSDPVLLVQPQTFMNLSGRSVRQVFDFYKLDLADLLVVADDVTLPIGKLRVRSKGSHGGHNGLRNIQEVLVSQEYARLRVGVGDAGEDMVEHVLTRFKPGERDVIDGAIAKSAEAVLLWVREGIEACMNETNGASTDKSPRKKGRNDGKSGESS